MENKRNKAMKTINIKEFKVVLLALFVFNQETDVSVKECTT